MNNEIILNEDNAISSLTRLSIKARKSEYVKVDLFFPGNKTNKKRTKATR